MAEPRATRHAAKARLLADQAHHPLQEGRARLAILSARLDRVARTSIAGHLSTRVRTERRFGPLLGQLLRKSLGFGDAGS